MLHKIRIVYISKIFHPKLNYSTRQYEILAGLLQTVGFWGQYTTTKCFSQEMQVKLTLYITCVPACLLLLASLGFFHLLIIRNVKLVNQNKKQRGIGCGVQILFHVNKCPWIGESQLDKSQQSVLSHSHANTWSWDIIFNLITTVGNIEMQTKQGPFNTATVGISL